MPSFIDTLPDPPHGSDEDWISVYRSAPSSARKVIAFVLSQVLSKAWDDKMAGEVVSTMCINMAKLCLISRPCPRSLPQK